MENESCVSSQAAATDKAKMKHNADGGLLTQTVTHQYTKAALDGECHKIRAATKGTRRRTIFIAALKLRKYIGKGLDEAEVRNALNDAGNYHRLPARSINEQIENGLAAA